MQVQCVCGSTLEIDQSAVGKVIQCPVCKANLAVQSPSSSQAPAAPVPVTPYASPPQAGDGKMHRSYGKGIAITFGLLLVAVFFAPWFITPPPVQAVFTWDLLKADAAPVPFPTSLSWFAVEAKLMAGVWIGLGAVGLLSFVLGIALRRIVLGVTSLILGAAGTLAIFYLPRLAWPWAPGAGTSLLILHIGIILLLFAARLRGLCWREPIVTRLLILVAVAPVVIGVLLPIYGGPMGAEWAINNIGDSPLVGLYVGAAAATLFALLALLPGGGGAAMAGLSYTLLILGLLYYPVRIFVDGLRSIAQGAQTGIRIEDVANIGLPLLHFTFAGLAVMLLTATGLVGIVGSLLSREAGNKGDKATA